MSSKSAALAAQATNRVIAVNKKYTVQSIGIWERVRRLLAVDPSRSNGIPLNPQFRNPPPGSVDPLSYTDPVTIPAGDIADNAYFKRDFRRSYPKLSVVNQGHVVGLLEMGNKVKAKKELIGEAGGKALAEVRERGEGGLARYLEGEVTKGEVAVAFKDILGETGLPPNPNGVGGFNGVKQYAKTEEQGFPEQYPCRTFA